MHWGFKVLFVIDKTLLRKKRNANVNKKNGKNAVSTGKYTILFFFLTLSYWENILIKELQKSLFYSLGTPNNQPCHRAKVLVNKAFFILSREGDGDSLMFHSTLGIQTKLLSIYIALSIVYTVFLYKLRENDCHLVTSTQKPLIHQCFRLVTRRIFI